MSAAAGKVDITPDIKTEKTWLAGFGPTGKRPTGVHDPLYARAIVLSDGKKTVALAAVDLIGLFREDVQEIRRRLSWDPAKSYVFISATHDHSGPDTLGMWGPRIGVSGVNRRYRDRILGAIAGLLQDLSKTMSPVSLAAVRADLDPRGLCADSRDPVVIDPELDAVQLRGKNGKSIATWVRWSCHPEVAWKDNTLITADYPGALCAHVERRTGGACLFQSGVIGGLMTPDTDHSGPTNFAEMERIGTAVAKKALSLLRGAPALSQAELSYRSKILRLPVENSRYIFFLPNLAFGHKILDNNGDPIPRWRHFWLALKHLIFFPLKDKDRPWVETEISHLRIGPAEILGIPGELFPELAIGGYDGGWSFGHPVKKKDNPNPPDLTQAPKPPYLRDKLKARVGLLVGLANDEIGYILPRYDFQAAPNRMMSPHPPGDHYEETESISPSAAEILLKGYDELLSGRTAD